MSKQHSEQKGPGLGSGVGGGFWKGKPAPAVPVGNSGPGKEKRSKQG